jgi:hypothetical protein
MWERGRLGKVPISPDTDYDIARLVHLLAALSAKAAPAG